jgi:hypothetical protein
MPAVWEGSDGPKAENKGMRVRFVMLTLLAALALAACGGSTTTVSTRTVASSATTSATGTSTATTPATSSSSTTPATTSSTSPSGSGACVAADLALSFLGGQGATGHGELGFVLRNTSAASCSTYGFPGVQFLDKSGAPLPTDSTRTTHDFFGSTPVVALTVAPGASVSFRLGVTHGAASSAGCTTAYGLQVIPPNDTATLHVSIPQGAYECGTTTVSPLRPGNTAYP